MGNKVSKGDFRTGQRNTESQPSPRVGRVPTGQSLSSSYTSPVSETRRFASAPSHSAASLRQPQSAQIQFYQKTDDSGRNIQLTRNIASISQLVREMYSLDLKIFGSASDRPEYDGERMAMIEQANLLFVKITSTLDHWAGHTDWWTEEEWDLIARIRYSASLHDPRRHRKNKMKEKAGPTFEVHEMPSSKFQSAKYDLADRLELSANKLDAARYDVAELEV